MLSVVLKFATAVVAAFGLLVGAIVPAGAATSSYGVPTNVSARFFGVVRDSAEPRLSTALVSFTRSKSSLVTDYLVSGTAVGGAPVSATGKSSPIVVSGLTSGRSYSFTVTALRPSGGGYVSAVSNEVVAPTLPGVPIDVSVVSAGFVSWKIPSPGGINFVNFDVNVFSENGELLNTQSAYPASCLLSGLVDGRKYFVAVRAVNPVGRSDWSSRVGFIYSSDVPSAPGLNVVAEKISSVELSYVPPSDSVSSGVSRYELMLSTDTPWGELVAGPVVLWPGDVRDDLMLGKLFSVNVSGSRVTVSRLDADRIYRFSLVAVGARGSSSAVGVEVRTKPARYAPAAPANFRMTESTQSSVSLAWDLPVYEGASPVTGFVIMAMSGDNEPSVQMASLPVSERSFTYTYPKLQNGEHWVWWIYAVNEFGGGGGTVVNVWPPKNIPLVPVGLSAVTNGVDQVQLSWSVPDSLDAFLAYPITDYVVEYSTDRGRKWVTVDDGVYAATGFTFRYPSVQSHVSWRWRVTAVNAYGRSKPAVLTYVTPYMRPDRVLDLKAFSSTSEVSLYWLPAVSGRAAAASDYVVEYSVDAGRTWVTVDDGVSADTSFTFMYPSVQVSKMWRWRVTAVNQYGVSPRVGVSYRTPQE